MSTVPKTYRRDGGWYAEGAVPGWPAIFAYSKQSAAVARQRWLAKTDLLVRL